MQVAAARRILDGSARFRFVVAFVGQVIFVLFILIRYGGPALAGTAEEAWGRELTHGYVPGEWASNLATIVHLLFAAVITACGLLQLVPQIRNNYRTFHRWNGRVYVATAVVMSFSGLFLIWTTGTVGDWTMWTGQSFNGLVIMACAFLAYRFARARDFARHRRWAIRLFLVVSGVWFFRVFMTAWFGIHQAPVGLDAETFTGWFVTTLNWSETLVPLALAQLYFYAQEKAGSAGQSMVGLSISLITLLMAFGIFMATVGMWFPGLMES